MIGYTSNNLWFSTHPNDPHTESFSFLAKGSTNRFVMVLTLAGDGPIQVLITDITPIDTILGLPAVFVVAIGAGAVALIVGLFLGRRFTQI